MPLNLSSASFTLELPGNALVRTAKVEVQADSARTVTLANLGQVRVQASAVNSGGTTAVVDFGTQVTVAGVTGNGTTKVRAVYQWRGDSFDTKNPVLSITDANGVASAAFPDFSTSRIQLELVGGVAQAAAEAVTLNLPGLPADLELRVNQGPVVWRWAGIRGAPGVGGWVAAGDTSQLEVDITAWVAPLLGNPDSAATVKIPLELRARVAGKLGLVQGPTDYDLVQKVAMAPDGNLAFDAEGDQNVSLALAGGSPTAALKEVWLTVTAAPPRERAVPAVGPERVTEVELVMDSSRSACVRFPENLLAELTALRLPLAAQDGTAEVRAQLLTAIGLPPNDEPGDPLAGASATHPVTLEPFVLPRGVRGPQFSLDTWVLLPFDKPVPLKGPVWISLQVTRGTVKWSLGKAAEGEDPFPVRRGAPTGPWLPLPAAVTALPGLGGRLHAIGHPPKESPLAPLQLQVQSPAGAGALADVSPTTKGVAVKLTADAGVIAQQAWLRFVARTPGTVTVSQLIRVVART